MAIVNPWDATHSTDPLATDLVSAGDDEIRNSRQTVRDEFRVEHDVGDVTVDANYLDTGRHLPGSARAYFFDSATWAAGPVALVETSNAGAWPPGVVDVQTDRSASGILDNGRLWVNIADCQPYVREQETTAAAWSPCNVDAGTSATAWVSLYARSWTTMSTGGVANESPGGGDNVRDTITGISAQSIVVPDDGKDYEVHVRAVIKYHHSGPNQGGAFWLEETAPGAADRDIAFYTTDDMSASADVGSTITLEYIDETVTNGDTYTFDVDFASTDAANLTVNPTSATFVQLNAIGAPYNVTGTFCRLFLTVRPRYLSASYTF